MDKTKNYKYSNKITGVEFIYIKDLFYVITAIDEQV